MLQVHFHSKDSNHSYLLKNAHEIWPTVPFFYLTHKCPQNTNIFPEMNADLEGCIANPSISAKVSRNPTRASRAAFHTPKPKPIDKVLHLDCQQILKSQTSVPRDCSHKDADEALSVSMKHICESSSMTSSS